MITREQMERYQNDAALNYAHLEICKLIERTGTYSAVIDKAGTLQELKTVIPEEVKVIIEKWETIIEERTAAAHPDIYKAIKENQI